MALRKAGLTDRFEYRSPIEYDSSRRLEHFVELIAAKAAAAEREACAKEAENEKNFDATECGIDVANDIAAAIRARGQK